MKVTENRARKAAKDWMDAHTKSNLKAAEMEAELAPVRAKYETEIKALDAKKNEAAEIIEAFVNDERESLLAGGKKSTNFHGLKVGFKKSPARLALTENPANWGTVLNRAAELIPQYTHSTLALDKSGIIKDAQEIGEGTLSEIGIKVEQKEAFFVKL